MRSNQKSKNPLLSQIVPVSLISLGLFCLLVGLSDPNGGAAVGVVLLVLFAGAGCLIYFLRWKKRQKARREEEARRLAAEAARKEKERLEAEQEAARRAQWEIEYQQIQAQKLTYEQLVSRRPPIHHYFRNGVKYQAWASHRRVGEELFYTDDFELGAYVFDDDLVVSNSIGQILSEYPHSQIFVCNIQEAPSGTYVDLIVNPIK